MNHAVAREALNRIYAAEHQVLFELVKAMGFKASHITAHLQGRELSTEEAAVQGLAFALSCLDGAEEEARHGYRPTPLPGHEEPIISASEADIILTRLHGMEHRELVELVKLMGMTTVDLAGCGGGSDEVWFRRGLRIIGEQIDEARKIVRGEVQG